MSLTPTTPDAEALFHEGTGCLSAGRLAEAERLLRESLRINPDLPETHANLALVFEWNGRLADAEASYRAALALNDGLAQIHLNLATLLGRMGRPVEAEQAYRRAIDLAPDQPVGWSNLGVLLAGEKREREAEQCYLTALTMAPDYANARFNLAYLLLRQARFEEGWAALEARDWYAALARLLPSPRWQGESLAGRRLLIGCEAGHGDMIQFSRYATEMKSRGAARVDILCHPALAELFTTLEGVDQVIPANRLPVEMSWDFWVPPLSLPGLCGTRMDSIPATLPYLHANPQQAAIWRERLPQGGIKVGLVWRGNPKFENDGERSLPGLATLLPLADMPNVSFVSLQKGAGEDEACHPPAGFPISEYANDLIDFAATAALIANLDLVIAVDTAVAHLAGALGKPCWILLPWYKTDWRWMDGRDDTPWYPDVVRLFRQPARGEWAPVVDRVAVALREFAG